MPLPGHRCKVPPAAVHRPPAVIPHPLLQRLGAAASQHVFPPSSAAWAVRQPSAKLKYNKKNLLVGVIEGCRLRSVNKIADVIGKQYNFII